MMQAIAGIWGAAPDATTHCAAMLAGLTSMPATLLRPGPLQGAMPGVLGSAPYWVEEPTTPQRRPDMDDSLLLVADARLDNRDELADALGLAAGCSDTQVLKAAWRRWGVDMVQHLLGGFALACWDPQQQMLFLARDHTGERPLFFTPLFGASRVFAFASMPLPLCGLPWVGDTIDVERMSHLLAAVQPADRETCFRSVDRLRPGHWLKLNAKGVAIRRYWHATEAPQIRYRRDEDYVEDFRERLDRAVAVRIAGEQQVASELSGGLDSSSITATAARLLEGQGRLTAFTGVPMAGYDGRVKAGRFGDEGSAAAEVAALYPNIDHICVDAAGRDLVEACAHTARLLGEPPLHPANELWLQAILDRARGDRVRGPGSRVLLQGAYGNLSISYDGLAGLSDLFVRGRWLALFRLSRQLRANGHVSGRNALAAATAPVLRAGVRRLFQPDMREFHFDYCPVHPDRAAEYDLPKRAVETFYGSEGSTRATRRWMAESFDPGPINASVAAGWQVEQRDPSQDKRVVEFCFGIPPEQYLVGGEARSLIRRAMQGRLPESTLRRTARGQQAADWYMVIGGQLDRLRGELGRVEQSPLVRHLIDTKRLRTLLENWPETGHGQQRVIERWCFALARGLAAANFIAMHDPDIPKDAELRQDAKKPGI